jgi:hypothetical protein
MFLDPACIPCIVKQAYNSSNMFTKGNKKLQLKILKEVCFEIHSISSNNSAPYFSSKIQTIIGKYVGSTNLYGPIKEINLKRIKRFYKFVKILIDESSDTLETAMRAAIIANAVDLGANPDFDLNYEINRISSSDIDLSALASFKKDLHKAKLILYIGDNYEEALFDKFLLNELKNIDTVFAVRSRQVLNDITLDDAKRLNIHKICRVIESGSTIAGTDLNECTPEFLNLYKNADIVIAKGQGNYETLIDEKRSIYFLFKVKCEAIERKSGFPKGKGILLNNQNIKSQISK